MSATPMHKEMEPLKDDVMYLKGTGLLISRDRNSGSKICDSKSYSSHWG